MLGCKNCLSLDVKQPEQPYLWSQLPKGKQLLDLNKMQWPMNYYGLHIHSKDGKSYLGPIAKNKTRNERLEERSVGQSLFLDKDNYFWYSVPDNIVSLQHSLTLSDKEQHLISSYKHPDFKIRATHLKKEINLSNCSDACVGREGHKTHLTLKNGGITLFSVVNEQKKADKVPGSKQLALDRIADELNEQWPTVFTSNLDLSLFSENIYFDNTILRVKTRGKKLYKLQILLFKWITKTFWADPSLQILKYTRHIEDNSIRIRWQIMGKPIILYPLALIGKTPSVRYQDFFSVLNVEDEDKIATHRLTKVVPTETTQKRTQMLSLLALLGLSGTKMRLPSLQEEPIIPSSSEPS